MAEVRLYLLRHAKAVTGAAGRPDIERALAPAGHKAMEEIAAYIAREGYLPQRILCSTAQRTRETLQPLLPKLSHETSIELTRAIYDADAEGLLSLISSTDQHIHSLMVIGHNPAIEELAHALARDGTEDALQRMAGKFPTGALAVIGFEQHKWSGIRPGNGRLIAFHAPGED